MRLVVAAWAETELAGEKPKVSALGIVTTVCADGETLRDPPLAILAKPINTTALLLPVFGVRIDVAGELVFWIFAADRNKIARDVAILIVLRSVVDVAWLETHFSGVFGARHDMHLLATTAAEARGIEAVPRILWVFELSLE